MIRLALFATILVCQLASAQGFTRCEQCDSISSTLVANWKKVTISSAGAFLATLGDPVCRACVEYTEGANELLFHLIDEHPKECFSALFSLTKGQRDAVAYATLNPIHDGIPVDEICLRLKKAAMPSELKRRALEFMKPAYKKQRQTVESWEKKNNKKWVYPPWPTL